MGGSNLINGFSNAINCDLIEAKEEEIKTIRNKLDILQIEMTSKDSVIE